MKISYFKNPFYLQILLLSIGMVFGFFAWQGHIGFNLQDEGFLWYGVQRVLLGEVPLRDFMAYDPGRYYWSAALLAIWGDNGIMPLRFTVAIFQSFGLFVGLWLIARTLKNKDILYIFICGLILIVWMFPRHKLFDVCISIFIIGVLTYLIEKPSKKTFILTGVGVGLIAVFGRNHGVYAVAGSLSTMLWLLIKKNHPISFIKGLLLWSLGIIIGYSPVLLMLIFIPDFALAFWESIQFLFEVKATNLPLPIPWPWTVNFNNLTSVGIIEGLIKGLFFIAIAAYGVSSMVWVILQKWHKKQVPAALVASAFLALPYAHFAYSRADMGHLAQGIFPFLTGCLIYLSWQKRLVKWGLSLVLCTCSWLLMSSSQPGWACFKSKNCIELEVSNSQLIVPTWVVDEVTLLRSLSNQYTPKQESFLTTPLLPGAYALLERKSPVWEIYALFPRSVEFENKEIERIKKSDPKFVVINNLALDGRSELKFSETHPLIYKYITQEFINNSNEKINSNILIYQKK